jgi:hypothetical protein
LENLNAHTVADDGYKTIVKHVIVTTVTVAVRTCANIGWRLDEAPGKTARPSGLKWPCPKCSCAVKFDHQCSQLHNDGRCSEQVHHAMQSHTASLSRHAMRHGPADVKGATGFDRKPRKTARAGRSP